MKNIFLVTFFAIASTISLLAQSPDQFNYQAQVRDAEGNIIPQSTIGLRISILEGSANGTVIYTETHSSMSNSNGVINLAIGTGSIESGFMDLIQWGAGEYFIQTEMDITGGSSYVLMGATQLLSVPYAMYAKHSGDNVWQKNINDISFSSGKVGIGNATPTNMLSLTGSQDTGGAVSGVNERHFLRIHNISNANSSSSGMTLKVGTDTNEVSGHFSVTPYSYNLLSGLAGYSILSADNNGLILRARDSQGNIKFLSGGNDGSYERMRIDESGFVGIGTANPTEKLTVQGTIESIEGGFKFPDGTIQETAASTTPISPWEQNLENISFSTGKVSIGNTIPTNMFSLTGSQDTGGAVSGVNERHFLRIHNISNANSSSSGMTLKVGTDTNEVSGHFSVTPYSYNLLSGLAGYSILSADNNGLILRARDSQGNIKFLSGGNDGSYERMRIDESGFVGIGTANPTEKLTVQGTIESIEGGFKFPDGTIQETAASTTPISPWEQNLENISFSTGKVSIGNTIPTNMFSLTGSQDTGGAVSGVNERHFFRIHNISNANSSSSGMTLKVGTDTNEVSGHFSVTPYSYNLLSGLAGYSILSADNNGLILRARDSQGSIKFLSGGNDGSFERMRIDESGFVGIGTSNPVEKVQIEGGDIYLSDVNSGVIMKSPDSNCWRMTVDNTGQPVFTSLTCPVK